MKPAPFRYVAPTTINDAVSQIAEFGYDAKILAGGQSLIPTMNFRLSQPQVLIDLNGVSELAFLAPTPAGGLLLGAMTRQRTVERSTLVASHAPLLHATMPHIAHVQIRNRGTIGGSLAHADPAAELPAVMVALGARFKLRSVRGERWVPADQFYLDLFTTALEPDELIFAIEVPAAPPRTGWSIQELARRRGDYALVGLAATVQLDEAGRCCNARLIYLSVGAGPTPAPAAAATLLGKIPDAALMLEAARVAAHQDIEPMADIHATAAYRRHLVAVLSRRALHEAFARARESS